MCILVGISSHGDLGRKRKTPHIAVALTLARCLIPALRYANYKPHKIQGSKRIYSFCLGSAYSILGWLFSKAYRFYLDYLIVSYSYIAQKWVKYYIM